MSINKSNLHKLVKLVVEEMAIAGSVNEEDKCAAIRAKEGKLQKMAREAESEGNYFADQYYGEARNLRDDNKECFPEYFEKEAPEPGQSGMDITKKQYGLGEDLDEGFTYDTMTDEEKEEEIAMEERDIASEKVRLERSLASAKNDVQRAHAQRIYDRNVEQSKKRIARLKGGPPIPPPERFQPPQPDRPAYPGDEHFYGYDPRQFAPPLPEGIKESKKDTLKITRSKLAQIIKEEMDNLYSAYSNKPDIIRTALEDSGELKDLVMEVDFLKLMQSLSEAEMPEAVQKELKEAAYNAIASLNDEEVIQIVNFLRADG